MATAGMMAALLMLAPCEAEQRVAPAYPEAAKRGRIEGHVLVQARVAKSGRVTAVRVVSGHPLLREAARRAVLGWTYRCSSGGLVFEDVRFSLDAQRTESPRSSSTM